MIGTYLMVFVDFVLSKLIYSVTIRGPRGPVNMQLNYSTHFLTHIFQSEQY